MDANYIGQQQKKNEGERKSLDWRNWVKKKT